MSTEDNHMEDLWGQYGHLTKEQHDTLKDFLSQAPENELEEAKFTIETQEQVALRFLRARKFDEKLALELLHECSVTLKEKKAEMYANMDPDQILGCEVNVLRKFYPHSQSGHDKLNRPLLFDNSGNMNMHGISHLTTPEGLIGYHFWTMEKSLDDLFNEIAENGKERAIPPVPPTGLGAVNSASEPSKLHNCSTCAIIDLHGISLSDITSSAVINHVKTLIQLDNVVYPEMLGKMFVINVPSFVVATYDMIKGWLDVRTQKKIEFLGSGHVATARLLEFIDSDELPTRYGGTRHHDPYSAHDVCHPHCQYLKLNSCACHNVLNIQVPSNKTFKLDLYNKGNTIDVAVLESASPVGDGEYAIDNTKRDKSAIFSESLVPGQFVVEGLTCAGFLSHKAKVNGTLECVTVTVEALDPDDGSASTNRTLHVYISNPSTAYMSSAKHCIYAYSIQ